MTKNKIMTKSVSVRFRGVLAPVSWSKWTPSIESLKYFGEDLNLLVMTSRQILVTINQIVFLTFNER